MKKILLTLTVILFGSICLLSQITPQTIYADENCRGLIPDYRPIILITDNCPDGVTLTQMPLPGTILDNINPSITINIWGEDSSGNRSNVLMFPVVLIDTIPPILEWPSGQISMTEMDIEYIYKNWEAAVKVKGIAHWMYDRSWTQGLAFADTLYVDSCGIAHLANIEEGLKYFNHIIKLTDEEYEIYKSLMDSLSLNK